MATLRDIRNRIKGVKNTSKITQAMKMVSAAKMKRAQRAIESARPYFSKLEEMSANLLSGLGEGYQNDLIVERSEVNRIAVVVIGSDRGLCGSFNANLFKYIRSYRQELQSEYNGAELEFIAVGNKPVSFYKKTDLELIATYRDVFQNLEFTTASDIVYTLTNKFALGEVDKVFVVYNEFINILKQIPKPMQLLPIKRKEAVEGDETQSTSDYIFEPDKAEILDILLPKLVNTNVWKALLESNAAEQAARMMAMETATKNAKDLIESLNVVYNRKRQDAITTEMMEIIGGAEALG
ncbi:MAG: F0F1 ATP synthase subunit gamma [Candidatus Kapaibacteriales bacterium]